MSDIYIPDCTQCTDKKGCCSSKCVDKNTKEREKQERQFDRMKGK